MDKILQAVDQTETTLVNAGDLVLIDSVLLGSRGMRLVGRVDGQDMWTVQLDGSPGEHVQLADVRSVWRATALAQ